MHTKTIQAAFQAEHETSAQSIRNNLTAARDAMREVAAALDAINARLGKRG